MSKVDWRWHYVFQTAMRFMDAGMEKSAAHKAAQQDAASLERAAEAIDAPGPDEPEARS